MIRRAAAAPGTVLDHRRDRHRQGAGGARHPCRQPAGGEAVRGAQLRRAHRVAARERAVRPHARRVHRRGRPQAGADRACLRRHALPRRDWDDEPRRSRPSCCARSKRARSRRIGENESRRVDVRFVTATNIDLKAAVESGSFRSDLYYRVNLHRVHMPPLREREGDVPLLVRALPRTLRPRRVDHQRRRAGARRARGLRLSRQRASARAHHPARRRDRAAARARAERPAGGAAGAGAGARRRHPKAR